MTEETPAQFPHLFSPLRVGPITLRNRVLITAHQPGLADGSVPGDRYIDYQRARARGGAGLQITGANNIHPSGGSAASQMLSNLDDRITYGYRRLAEAVHAEGGRMLAQLAHGGALGNGGQGGPPLWAPSAVASELYRDIPHEMTKAEIAEVVQAYADAAWRVRSGDMDGVEISAAFGLLVAAFLSPYSNQRTDEYGGSLDNRMRFCLEVVDAVRRGAGPDLIVGVRIPGDERVPHGLDVPQVQEIARRLEATGQVDYLNVIVGTNMDRFERVRHWPPTPAPHGLHVHLAQAIKQVVSLPVFTVGRITDPRQAEAILAAGQADMVGMTRAHIADPDLVAKTRAGRLEDIRPCVGANVCISRLLSGMEIHCIHNPEAGRESQWGPLKPAAPVRRVVVIGGGPAGLEAARVAAQRGHQVDLYEREAALGGQLRLWAKGPATQEFAEIIAWQARQLRQLGVTVHLSHALTPDEAVALQADVVIAATGAHAKQPALAGNDKIKVVTPHAVMAGGLAPAQRVVVWDNVGGQAALTAAETLIAAGAKVEVVTPHFAVGEDLNVTLRIPIYERLLGAGAAFRPNTQVQGVEGEAVVVRNLYSGEVSRLDRIDLLVAWLGGRVDDELSRALPGRVPELHSVGDCVAPRTVEMAMAEGARVARGI